MVETKAVCCLLGAVLINITLGTLYSVGNLNPYIASYMRKHVDPEIEKHQGMWITSAFLFGQGIFLILGAHIERIYDVRVACIVGCIIHTMSCFLAATAIKMSYFVMVLVYGFGTGCGAGSAYMATIVATQRWFPLSKGLFTGVILTGFGFGGLIYTNLQTWYINPNNKSPEKTGYFTEDVYENLPGLFYFMGATFVVLQSIGCALAFPPPILEINPATDTTIQSPQDQQLFAVLPDIKQTSELFQHRIFFVIGIMMALVIPGMTFVNSMGKSYGQIFIPDDRFLAVVTAVSAVANACGRLFWGFLMDRLKFSSCLLLKNVLFTTLLITFPFRFILESKVIYFLWMLGLFFNFAGIFVIFPVFIDQVFGARFSGMAYGILYNFLSTSAILSSYAVNKFLKKGPVIKAADYDPRNEPILDRLIPPLAIAFLYACCITLYYVIVPVDKLEEAIDKKRELAIAKFDTNQQQKPSLSPQKSPQASIASSGSSVMVGMPNQNAKTSKKIKSKSVPQDKQPQTIVEDRKKDNNSKSERLMKPTTKSVIPATAATQSELSTLEGKNSLGTLVYLHPQKNPLEIRKLIP